MMIGSRGSIYDVARQAGVSIGTVSRVFNNKTNVADETRDRVLVAARTVNYLPRISTRRLTIGLVIQEMANVKGVGFTSEIIARVASQVARRESVLEVIPLTDLKSVYRKYISGLIAIIFDTGEEILQSIRHVPVVLINNQLQRPNFHSVCSDHQEGGHMATKHLLERGHKRIGFLEISPKNWGARAREAGYRQAIAQSERAVDEDLIVYTRSQPLRDVLSALLSRGITGLVICGEDLSMAANQVLIHELRVRMPDDLSVVSFELPPVSALLTPPQTTIEQPWDDIGSVAVETVLQLAYRGDGRNVNILLHNHLIERNSVRTMG